MSTRMRGIRAGRLGPVTAHREERESGGTPAGGKDFGSPTRADIENTVTEFLAATADSWADLVALDARSRRIVDAARDCFADVGLEETTMVNTTNWDKFSKRIILGLVVAAVVAACFLLLGIYIVGAGT